MLAVAVRIPPDLQPRGVDDAARESHEVVAHAAAVVAARRGKTEARRRLERARVRACGTEKERAREREKREVFKLWWSLF